MWWVGPSGGVLDPSVCGGVILVGGLDPSVGAGAILMGGGAILVGRGEFSGGGDPSDWLACSWRQYSRALAPCQSMVGRGLS